jgi:hypothetical protein
MIDAILLAGALLAAAAAPDDGTTVPPPASASDDSVRECRVVSEVGSRLARRRICATRAEWAESDRAARTNLEGRGRQVSPTYDDLVRNSQNRPSTRCARC